MDPTDLSDAQLDQLADQLAGRLPSGTHGDRVVLSRRAFAAAVGGTLGASGLVALGVDPAAAQAAGQVGTSSSPVDAFVYDLDVANALQSDLDAGGNALTNVGSVSTESATINANGGLTLTVAYEQTISFSSGGANTFVLSNISPGNPFVVTATPANDPNNDHGYNITKTFFDASTEDVEVEVVETEKDGGGEAKIIAWEYETK